jgi:hypothetical protein
MPQPTLTDVHVNTPLTVLSLAYAQEERNFISSRVFPLIPVSKASDRYYTYSRADFNRDTMRKRAPATESAGGGYKIDNTATYSVDVWALHKDIDDQIRANADAAISLDMDATRWLTTQYLISKEVDWAAKFFANVWTSLLTGVAAAPGANQALQWNDANSQPIVDIRNLKRTIQLASGGFRPNKMVLGRPVFDILCDHPDFVDRIKYGQTPGSPARVTLDAMAALFELDEVLVMDAIINTGVEGTTLNALESNSFIGGASGVGGKAAMLVYTPPSPGLMVPGCGFTFAWTGLFGSAGGNRILSWFEQRIRSTRVEIEAAYAHKLASADMGAYIATIVA